MEKNENPKNQAGLIWNVADILRGGWKQHEYQDVILPLVVLKRLDNVLAKTKQDVLRTYNQMHGTMSDDSLSLFLEKESGYKFYNTSPYDFKKLLDDSEGIYANFINYLDGFSPNVRDIVTKFEFQKQLNKLKSGKMLHLVLKELDKVDLRPEVVNNHDMGYIFEELIRKFNEQSNETAGEHYTPREVIRLMVRLLLEPDADRIKGESKIIEMYDPACGTGGMLTIGKEYIQTKINPDAEVYLYGQELNPQTFAIAKSDILIKGEDANRIKGGSGEHAEDSTLSNDQFYDKTFDYVIANPPYGVDWKKDKDAVEAEAARGDAGRFPAGIPAISDGQMLFMQHMINKLRPVHEGGGRVAVVHNGSPLAIGDAGSGPDSIRRWIIENDYLEAIIALPWNMFYNTPINTYVWILTNRKSAHRKNKVQLINAMEMYHKLRKHLGDKDREMSADDIDEVVALYLKADSVKKSVIVDTADFGYKQLVIERPLLNQDGSMKRDSKGRLMPDKALRAIEKIPLDVDEDTFLADVLSDATPDAWIDKTKTKTGYEILINKYFYNHRTPRPLQAIDDDLKKIVNEILLLESGSDSGTERTGSTANMKDSGISWIGAVPEHWEFRKMHQLFKIHKEIVGDKSEDYTLLALTLRGIIPRSEVEGGKNPEKYDAYQIVKPNDLVFCLFDYDVTPRTVGYVREEGIITGAYTVFRPIVDIEPEYYSQFFTMLDNTKELLHLCTGLRSGLSKPTFLGLTVPFPPKDEQREIASTIRSKEKRELALKKLVKKQDALLKERHNSEFFRAITDKS
jgi:type I restriction enzyme M protein